MPGESQDLISKLCNIMIRTREYEKTRRNFLNTWEKLKWILPFIPKGFPAKVSPKVNKNRLCFNISWRNYYSNPADTVYLALCRRTRRTRTVCSEGKQQKKHSDASSLLRKQEVKFNPLGFQKKKTLVRQLNANKKQHRLKCWLQKEHQPTPGSNWFIPKDFITPVRSYEIRNMLPMDEIGCL